MRRDDGASRNDVGDLLRRLTKEELLRFDGRPLFPERRAHTVHYALSGGEAALYAAVTDYVRKEMDRAERFAARDEKRRRNVGFALQILQRRRFVFDVHARPLLLTTDHPDGEPLPERKFWCFSTGADHDDEPYGLGLGHWLYWPVWFKKNQVRFWLLYLEKYGMPTPLAEYSRDEQKQMALDLARSVHTESALAVPEGVVLKLVEAMRAGQAGYESFHAAMNDAITTIILSQTMTTEDGSSLSQAQVHMEVRREIVESDAWLVDESFNRGPAVWWRDMNYPGAAVPRVRRVMDDPAERKELAERDEIVSRIAQRPFTDEYVEQTYHVALDREAAPPPRPAPAPPADLAEEEEDPVEALAGRVRAELGPLVDTWVARLRAAE